MGVAELSVLGPLNVDEHHERVGEEHTFFVFDSNLSSEIFSQAVHETFDCIIIVLLVACVAAFRHNGVDCLHALDGKWRVSMMKLAGQ